MSSVTTRTHHSGDDKDDDKSKGGKEDDEDDVVGGEQGGGGEEVGVHLPHLVGRISFMFLPTISNDKSVVYVDINCPRPFSSFSLSVAYILGGLLLFLLLKQLPPRVLEIEDIMILMMTMIIFTTNCSRRVCTSNAGNKSFIT